ncbi:MAG: Asp-tRNA(Asn)/Glu-tRNA(Gln) amidotransferase subunit GatC [Deltaproteobacteria bacterium]|jgi:aspartyl-tRNA(Asn)/glutamyl-tRNA(Gln) amidotransferase subunit C|nr:Asp-tRNA(Asn)/Glu-tRNA(Gln) amidotransferase subunit GatC [Deltaproteobacteria bacterium]MBW2522051.1 Asp-tRNA(Asn)/Glu-tRNA(Gln) amidotransferase subunit GatC [Deltaproteobacteria bacterium]
MKITPAEISHVAGLARLSMTREEGEAMARHLEEILSYVAKLNELDTAGVAPTTHAISIVNAFREDEVRASLPREKTLANAPRQNGESFVVPRVI